MSPADQSSQTGEGTHDRLQADLIFASEVTRGIMPPTFDGVEVELQGQRVNLWWHDGRRSSRAFSDAFLTGRGELVIVAAEVVDMIDANGLAISLRALLRGLLATPIELAEAIAQVANWAQHDPQWNGLCHLGIAVLQKNRVLECVCRGSISLTHTDANGTAKTINNTDTLPILVGTQHEEGPQVHTTALAVGDLFTMAARDTPPEHLPTTEDGDHPVIAALRAK